MKVLLIQPPVQDFYDTTIRLQPLGLGLIKAAVKKYLPGVDIVVRDYHHGHGRRTIPLPPELLYLREYYPYPDTGPFSTFHHYYHFGAPFEEIAADAIREAPDLIGISCLFSPYYREALACARAVKQATKALVVMGGSHVSARPEDILKDPSVDFVIRGEGERPMVALLEALADGQGFETVPNLGFKRDGGVVLNSMAPNYALDDIPSADLSDLAQERYRLGKRSLCFITTSRGCPHHCRFCSVRTTFGPIYRRRSVEGVLNELEARYEQGYRIFDFEDDNLSADRQAFVLLLEGIIRRFAANEADFVAMNGLSYMSLDRELLALMRQAGFRQLNLSLVSANEVVLKQVKRPHTLEKFFATVDAAHDLGFDITAYQIVGLPNETLDEMVGTIALLARLPVLIGASVFYLTPGCEISRDFPAMNERDVFRSRSTAMAIETEHAGRDDLYTLLVTARILNFLKGLSLDASRITFEGAIAMALAGGARERRGGEILSRLLSEKMLYAATRTGYEPLRRFSVDLFMRVIECARHVSQRDGAVIKSNL